MKRIFSIFAISVALLFAATSCGPKEDEKLVALQEYIDGQNIPGLYTAGSPEYVFNKADGQCYINTSTLTFRIQNNTANKYLDFILSKAPVVGKTVDVTIKSKGVGLASNATYRSMTVDKIEENLCYLVGGEEANYTAMIIAWME